VIVTEVDEATPLVVIVKLDLVAPAGIVTLAGTCAAEVLLLDNVTTAPPAGAAPFRLTVPVELFPPTTDVGLLVTEERLAALTVRLVLRVSPYVPEIVTEVLAETGLVVIVNVADVLPAATVILAGTCATAVLLLWSVTVAPPEGAAPLKVTVPVDVLPPTTDVGLPLIEDKVAALMLRAAVRLTPSVAVTVVEVLLATVNVIMVKFADVLPAGTVTEAGTVAAVVLLLCRDTLTPPVGAGPVSVIVPVEGLPPVTLVGLTVTDVRLTAAGVTVKVAVCVDPNTPVIVTPVFVLTAFVEIVNVALVFPLGTRTFAGVCAAAALLLDSVTVAPPAGAGPLRVTVPVTPVPPTTVDGLTETDASTTVGNPPPYTAW
jgi:hypothetical protein